MTVGAVLDCKGVGTARIEPDIENVFDLFVMVGVIACAQKIAVRPGEPGIGALGRDRSQDPRIDLRIIKRLAGRLIDKHGQRRAPGALAADQPVGPALDHGANPVAANIREEGGLIDCRQGLGTQRIAILIGLIHADEPLRRIEENHWGLRAPGMRIRVFHPPARQKRARLDQLVHDRTIGRAKLARLLALGFQHF